MLCLVPCIEGKIRHACFLCLLSGVFHGRKRIGGERWRGEIRGGGRGDVMAAYGGKYMLVVRVQGLLIKRVQNIWKMDVIPGYVAWWFAWRRFVTGA